ncbi:MAG: efflux RND transporter periplasmic adaptor subunit [Gammaproteobacteria bacterium]
MRRTVLTALVLLAGGVSAQDDPPPEVIVSVAERKLVVDRIEALGTLQANESVTLTANVTERVTAIHFDDGDRVEEGDVLVEMTSAEEHALLEEARATVEEAQSQYERNVRLSQEDIVSESVLDTARREWETAKARLEAIQSQLDDRLINAPFSGVVGLRNISPGALVQPGEVITTLDDDSVMKLDFSVPATFLTALQPGAEIVATADAFGDEEFEGEVSAVGSRIDPITRTVQVRAMMPNPDKRLRPGLLMQVDLLNNPRQAVVIPEEALVPLGEQQFVMVVGQGDGNTVERREVGIGRRMPGEVEIVQGLEAGEMVITHGTMKARPGQTVQIQAIDDGTARLSDMIDGRPAGEMPARSGP